ncbi:MAG: sigma-54 dependent transcriptional regulator [Spirochaetia bacterium]|jgi:two-component system response regulator AtoC|nr:sigma-54 dependent transcriptional regulator [Spirochaetia bacterium]
MRILIVDDEARMAESIKEYFQPEGLESDLASNGQEGRRKLEENAYDALVSDLRMPGMDGMQLLRWVKEEGPDIPVIMISAHGDIRDAVDAMREGAYDYLVKPFDPDELLLKVRKAVDNRRLRLSVAAGMAGKAKDEMIGESPAMRELDRILAKASPSGATMLITGESGTGKEVAARVSHRYSRREGPFVPINMGAFPEQLLESELFGYEKGAFTGADSRKQGLFESAQGGSLFLDEIAELPLHLQVKLLRVIQERKVQRLGSLKGTPIDLRLVAATNRDLEKEVKEGRFREDLYYRINVIRIQIPPLRERPEDIPLLAGAFLARVSGSMGRKSMELGDDAIHFLLRYDFPGNVRELENAIERACILSESDVLRAKDFEFLRGGKSVWSEKDRPGPSGHVQGKLQATGKSLEDMEREAIVAALARNSYHRERTAEELGITRRTLLNKIKAYGLEAGTDGENR